jgi:hypothetical protein
LDEFTPFTRVLAYREGTPTSWQRHDQDWRTVSIARFHLTGDKFVDAVILSEEGHVRFIGSHQPAVEKIPGAGVYSEGAQGLGYLSDVRQIGEHLFAAGYSGQVYKRLEPDRWVHMDDGILQERGMNGGQYAVTAINGPHENAIYAAGYVNGPGYPARASFWDGRAWSDVRLPYGTGRITGIHVESESRIWMCGSDGTLLLGNAADGFGRVSAMGGTQLFFSACQFQDTIYLGSDAGLFAYDPGKPAEGIRQVTTGLVPELQDANVVDSRGKVLWSIGPKDIARFDGEKWERVQCPVNPPIKKKRKPKTP